MKKSHLLWFLLIPLLSLSCSKNEEWKSTPEGAYLDITEMTKVTICDLTPDWYYGQRAVIELKSNIRERVQSYSWVGKNNFLTITYLGESVMRVEIQWVLSDSFPGGMAISFQDPGFSEDPLKCWIWSHGTDADEAEFDRFIEELRSRKVPIKKGK